MRPPEKRDEVRVPSPKAGFPFAIAATMLLLLVTAILYGLVRRRVKRSLPLRDANHDISRLPMSFTPLEGRRALLRQLDGYLADPDVAVVACIAAAGVGKSALVEHWLNKIQPHYGGLSREGGKVFGWSFHHQSDSGTPSNSGLFFSKALSFFGHEGPRPESVAQRATLLGERWQQQPSLLILDGVSSLQYPLTDAFVRQEGRFFDPGLYWFLRFMRTQGLRKKHKNRLVLMTSRQPLHELMEEVSGKRVNAVGKIVRGRRTPCAGYRQIFLDNLTEGEGVQLLKKRGVPKSFFQALPVTVRTLHGHALSLLLLGGLIARRGDDWPTLKPLLNESSVSRALFSSCLPGDHVQRILDYYDKKVWPAESPHGCFLRLFGMFDRPMTEADFQILRADAGLAEPLKRMDFVAFMAMLGDLEQSGLLQSSIQNRWWEGHPLVQAYFRQKLEEEHPIEAVEVPPTVSTTEEAPQEEEAPQGEWWEGHPLVQAYFSQKLEEENAAVGMVQEVSAPQEEERSQEEERDRELARSQKVIVPQDAQGLGQAQRVLFDYFQVMTRKEQPDTREELESLYRAVWHGCRAGCYKEALYSVYVQRIHRGADAFSRAKLGTHSSKLTALSGFFPEGWAAPPVEAALSEGDRAWLLAETTHCLTQLGRLPEALGPQEEGLRLETKRGAWQGVPRAAAALCDLQLANGRLQHALTTAEYGERWAERSGLLSLQMLLKTKRAIVLHRLGAYASSQVVFQEVEAMQVEQTPDQPWLQGQAGKEYAVLLLEQRLASLEEILQRAEAFWQPARSVQQTPSVQQAAVQGGDRAFRALGLLTQGRVLAAMDDNERAYERLNAAATALGQGENEPIMAEVLLQRALFMRRQREPEAARHDLEEGLEMAQRCGLALLEVDGKLLEGHMLLDENKREEAEDALVYAETLITQMAYGQQRVAATALRDRLN